MTQRLFVYGTLAPGRPNEHILAPLGGAWEPATVRGHLKREGWGAAMGFPGLVLDDAGEEVTGLVFSSENLSSYWSVLDEFEGADYERLLQEVRLADGNSAAAFIYVIRQD